MAKAPNSERVIAIKGDSLESLAGLLARGLIASFDAVYVDASHEVSWEMERKHIAICRALIVVKEESILGYSSGRRPMPIVSRRPLYS